MLVVGLCHDARTIIKIWSTLGGCIVRGANFGQVFKQEFDIVLGISLKSLAT